MSPKLPSSASTERVFYLQSVVSILFSAVDMSMGTTGGDLAMGSGPDEAKMAGNAWDSYDTVFLNAKAGMDGVDKKKVQKVVYDMSKGSRYFNNEQRKEAELLQRIQGMNARAERLTTAHLADHEKVCDLKMAELEVSRDLSHIWMHVDMDAFYAAVEILENPELVGKPVAVGGMSMICTANYEARKFGVRAAMPGFIARKLCPDLIFVSPDFKRYTRYSELSRQVFKEYDANFFARSLDEAYLDITIPCQSRKMSAAEVAEELRTKVHLATGLTCSAGIGPNRLIAKVCTDINKPNGQYVLPNERGAVMTFISSLPIRKVGGIGKVTERLLKEVLDINICADLLIKRSYISALFSQISTDFYLAIGLGIGGSETPEKEHRKSVSHERTFRAISDEPQLLKKLEELVDLLAKDMRKVDLQGRTLTLKLKETGFEVRSRAVSTPSFICTKEEIWDHACKLLKAEMPLSLRLMGLRMSHFKDEKPEFSDPSQRTLTSFITQSGTSKSRTSGTVPEPPDAAMQLASQEDCHGENIEESNDHSIDERPEMGMDETVDRSQQKQATKSLQRLGPSPITPPTAKRGFVSTRPEVLTSTQVDQADVYLPESSNLRVSQPTLSLRQGNEPSCALEFDKQKCEAVQPGCNPPQGRYGVDDTKCTLCGFEVNTSMPGAWQEHEDFHFAMSLQAEGDRNISGRSGTIMSIKQPIRPEEKGSRKRKTSGGKYRPSPQKLSSHRPIETFFKDESK